MTLDKGSINTAYSIQELKLPTKLKERLEILGMTLGTKVEILNKKGKGTLIIRVRGTRLAIGKDISQNIIVRS